MYHIAICDDEDTLIDELKDNLKQYATETAKEFCYFVYHDDSELLKNYNADYDLIFMDIKMEQLNGLKTAEEIRKIDSTVGLIFLTSLKQYVWKGHEYGAVNYLEDGSADYEKLMSGDYILVAGNRTAEEIFGWSFALGDTITLHYYDGNKTAEKEVTILGTLNEQYVLDNNGLEGWFLMPEQAILNLVSYDSLNAHLLVSTKADKEAAIGKYLTELIAEKPELTMETLAERRIAYEQSANQIFGAISGLAIFIMMFNILSMINTLITNIVTRKQELAMLESIGMSKGQIRKMLLSESLLLVVAMVGVTITIGTLCGYVLSNMLYHMGAFYMAFQFPTCFALAYTSVLIAVPLFITLVSMHSFSKEILVERLRGTEN